MISVESVVALHNNFVTIDRLAGNQLLKGVSDSSPLLKIMEGMSEAYLLETKYFQLIASPEQKFVVSPTMCLTTEELRVGDLVLTDNGFSPIKFIHKLNFLVEMANLISRNNLVLAEGFYILSD